MTYVANAAPDAWSALGFGNLCVFVYQYGKAFTGPNLPYFLYQPDGVNFQLTPFNM
ncbi:MAG: hypothetical protein HC809_01425 [Gammaproteobacteria bacterium]|nr:hypothetical protein [Gammaproteobacteria bacterium]